MQIDTNSVLNYIENQEQIFNMLNKSIPSDFNKGILEGFNLIKTFIELYEEKEGEEMNAYYEKERKENGNKS